VRKRRREEERWRKKERGSGGVKESEKESNWERERYTGKTLFNVSKEKAEENLKTQTNFFERIRSKLCS